MSVLKHIGDMLLRNQSATTIVVSKRVYADILREINGMRRYTSPEDQVTSSISIMGRPVSLIPPSMFCRKCGAPAEAESCSYCGSPSEFVEVRVYPNCVSR